VPFSISAIAFQAFSLCMILFELRFPLSKKGAREGLHFISPGKTVHYESTNGTDRAHRVVACGVGVIAAGVVSALPFVCCGVAGDPDGARITWDRVKVLFFVGGRDGPHPSRRPSRVARKGIDLCPIAG